MNRSRRCRVLILKPPIRKSINKRACLRSSLAEMTFYWERCEPSPNSLPHEAAYEREPIGDTVAFALRVLAILHCLQFAPCKSASGGLGHQLHGVSGGRGTRLASLRHQLLHEHFGRFDGGTREWIIEHGLRRPLAKMKAAGGDDVDADLAHWRR